MIGGIEMNTYQRITKMTHSIDSVIVEAQWLKHLSTNLFKLFGLQDRCKC